MTESLGNADLIPTYSANCDELDGNHFLAPDFMLLEVVDPDSGEALGLEHGVEGELVATHLERECVPLVRFRVRDRVRVKTSPCACGRTTPRLNCVGRTDDLLIVAGVNVWPSAIKDVVTSLHPRTTGALQILLPAPPPRVEPPLRIQVEYGAQARDLRRAQARARGADPRQADREGGDRVGSAGYAAALRDEDPADPEALRGDRGDSHVSRYIVAVDIGGTFSDLVCLDRETGEIRNAKVPSTPPRFIDGVIDALDKAQVPAAEMAVFKHGSTIATNAIIQRAGAKTALVTTEGFRDVLLAGRADRTDHFDLSSVEAPPLVPRRDILGVRERVDSSGKPIVELDEASLERALELLRKRGIEAVAVVFLNSFMNPEHEHRTLQAIVRRAPRGVRLLLIRHPPGAEGVRADVDDGRERVHRSDRRQIPLQPDHEARGLGLPEPDLHHPFGRRCHESRRRPKAARENVHVRPRRRSGRRCVHRRAGGLPERDRLRHGRHVVRPGRHLRRRAGASRRVEDRAQDPGSVPGDRRVDDRSRRRHDRLDRQGGCAPLGAAERRGAARPCRLR